MRRVSQKRASREREAKPFRDALIKSIGRCQGCGKRHAPWQDLSRLCVHEIAGGPLRQKSLDKPYAVLVLCWGCNGGPFEDKSIWPQARQLALLQDQRPDDYDLVAFNYLVNPNAPNRITQEEVDEYRNQA